MVPAVLQKIFHFSCVFLILHIWFVPGQGDIPKCKDAKSKLVGEICFQFNSSPVTWYQAKSNCHSNGMTLAYVNSRNQIKEILKDHTNYERAWIGASDEKNEGQFVWDASNENATELLQLWSKGEPNNITRQLGDEDCVNIFQSFYANDDYCNFNWSYICMETSCPYNLKVVGVLNGIMTLSWKPGFNGGQPEKFTVKYQDLMTNISTTAGTVTVPRVNQTSSLAVEYSISGLPTKRSLKIYVEKLHFKERACTPMTVIHKTTGPPECPVNITTHDIIHDRVSLSWTPGKEDELPQTFHILAHNMSLFKTIQTESVSVGKVYATNYSLLTYTVANLSEATNYTFSVEVENNSGIRKCQDDFVLVMTTSDLRTSSFPIWLICLMISTLLVLTTGIVGFVYCRIKAHRTLIVKKSHIYDSLTRDMTVNDNGLVTDVLYTAPIDISAYQMAETVVKYTNQQDKQPITNESIYANTRDMIQRDAVNFSETEENHIYKNII